MTDLKFIIKTFSSRTQCYLKCGPWSGAGPRSDRERNSTEIESKHLETVVAIRQ